MRKAKGRNTSGISKSAHASERIPAYVYRQRRTIPIPIKTIGMRLPPNNAGGKWVASSKPQALGMVANDRIRLNIYLPPSFVLMELLVVIAIIALLLGILLPTVQRIRRQAKSVACQANLHQWGLLFSMYTGANDGKYFAMSGGDTWIGPMQPYYSGSKDSLFLCPMAKKHYVEAPVAMPDAPALDTVTKKRYWVLKYIGGGTKYHAWWLLEPSLFCSFGLNDWVIDQPGDPAVTDSLWRTSDIRDASNVPVFLDCVWRGSRPHDLDKPPVDENYPPRIPLGADTQFSAMQYFCIDRHEGAINGVFMDGSVRKAGLKQLWAFRWNRSYDPNGPWTKAGGVEPSEWPKWMRGFKDY